MFAEISRTSAAGLDLVGDGDGVFPLCLVEGDEEARAGCAGAATTCSSMTGTSGSGSSDRLGRGSGVMLGLAAAEADAALSVAVVGPVASEDTRATVCDSGDVLDAALITATLATDPAMRTPPAATTVAMMLDLCMVFPFFGAGSPCSCALMTTLGGHPPDATQREVKSR